MPDTQLPVTTPIQAGGTAPVMKKRMAFLPALAIAVLLTIGFIATPFIAPVGEGALAIFIMVPFIFFGAILVNWALIYLVRLLVRSKAHTALPVWVVGGLNAGLLLYQLIWFFINPQ